MKYKTVKKLWLAAAILTTTTLLWTNVNAMETPAASGAGVIRALNEQRILSEQYALQQYRQELVNWQKVKQQAKQK